MRKLIVSEFMSLLPAGVHREFQLKSAIPYPSGVVALDYQRAA